MLIQLFTVLKRVLKSTDQRSPKEDKEKIEKSLEDLKGALKNEKTDPAELKEKTDKLVQDSMKLGEIMYKEAQEKAEKKRKECQKWGESKSDTKKSKKGKKDLRLLMRILKTLPITKRQKKIMMRNQA